MKYILMNYTYEVAEANIDIDTKDPDYRIKTIDIIDFERAPFCFRSICDPVIRATVASQWLNRRLMPIFRENANSRSLNEQIGENRLKTALKFYAASVSDDYWFRPVHSRKTWEDINFFTNDFSDDIGNFIFGIEKKKPDIKSPDITTNGSLPKTWRRIDGHLVLYKGGSAPDFIEPCNEMFASKLMETYSKAPFVKYRAIKSGRNIYSVCENFLTEGIEFVPAVEIYKTAPKLMTESVTQHMLKQCAYYKIPDVKIFMANMKAVDFLIGNRDRHLGNWGFLFDVDQAKFIGPAPLFDNGASMVADFPEMVDESTQEIYENEAAYQFKDVKNYMYDIDTTALSDLDLMSYILELSYALANFDYRRIDGYLKRLAGRNSVLDQYIEQSEIKHEQKIERIEREENIKDVIDDIES